MRCFLSSLLLSLCVAVSANAQGVATFTYQRGVVQLLRAHPPALPALPWQGEAAPVQLAIPALEIAVDIRPSTSLYQQEGWVNMGGLSGANGMFFVFDKPQPARVGALSYYQPLDVLWLDENGVVTSIAPSLKLAEISVPLVDTKPSKAVLFLAGGMADVFSISPGDKITGSEFFQTPPKVLTAP
jgi:uncharacterized membrane protein (UPF0127 family)